MLWSVCIIGVSGSPLSLYTMDFLPSILGLLNRRKWSDCLKCQHDPCLLAYHLFSPALALSLIFRQTQNDYQNDFRAKLNNLADEIECKVKYSKNEEVKEGQERLWLLLTHSKVNIHIFPLYKVHSFACNIYCFCLQYTSSITDFKRFRIIHETRGNLRAFCHSCSSSNNM